MYWQKTLSNIVKASGGSWTIFWWELETKISKRLFRSNIPSRVQDVNVVRSCSQGTYGILSQTEYCVEILLETLSPRYQTNDLKGKAQHWYLPKCVPFNPHFQGIYHQANMWAFDHNRCSTLWENNGHFWGVNPVIQLSLRWKLFRQKSLLLMIDTCIKLTSSKFCR